MGVGRGTGRLILSVDLELDLAHHEPDQRRLDEVRKRLVDFTRTLRLPATWAVADPVLSAATESILAAGVGHEIAVLGERAWLGRGCGRVRLERELARRFDNARRAGIAVSTLALRNVEQVLDLDLLLDHGVTAVRGPAVESRQAARKLAAPPIRYGIWQPPAAWKIPPQSAWWTPSGWLIRREIRRAIRQQTILHLEIDAPRLVSAPDQAMTLVTAVLAYAAARRDAGQLEVLTIGQVARQALAERTSAPSRSILRPAA